ncbi:hypothetical protein FE249_17950 (plasmid) [Acidiphilium multivorum]|uniref:type IV secretory system conjugative DNA transfer family protein n=1 Tax=Acidiphilium multivorum TaxID=62140 RepID=UPI001F4C4581|nr:FtsK/SpoIIIE domain-containing protein [Acidiphilium multivorum]UNC16140.1 hypothetical protein FE249_17950 [Acidiphilium multivorum]
MSRKPNNFAVDSKFEIDSSNLAVDVRRPGEKIAGTLHQKPLIAIALGAILASAATVPETATVAPWLAAMVLATFMLLPDGRRDASRFLPLRSPTQDTGRQEYKQLGNEFSDLQPGSGIFFLGTEIGSGREIWMSNEDAREHFWITGTTGSGKTELLMAIMMNALSWGSGFVMIDGKGDIATPAKVWRMMRAMGRTDDFFLLNFMVPGRNAKSGGLLSHTLNPFANYSKAEIMQVIESLLPKASGDSGGWQQKAINLMKGVVTLLVWLRDHHGKPLSVQSLQEGMVLDSILRALLPKEVCAPVYRDMPVEVREPLMNYANNLSSFPRELMQMPADGSPHPLAKPGTPHKFVDQTNTQHGFLTSILGPPLSLLGESYRHIFGTQYADIDIFDIVLSRRVLVVVLPALQKSLEEMGNLGRITVSTLKTMLGDSLGSEAEGSVANVYDKKLTSAPSPFQVILDEWTYYITQGAAMMPAQARGIGFSFFFAVQSLSAIFQRDATEGRDAYNTVNTRIFMFAVDEETTIKSALETAGKADIVKPSVFTYQGGGGLTNSPVLGQDRTIQEKERLTGRHIRRLGKGQFYLMRGDKLVLGLGPYIDDASLTALDKRELAESDTGAPTSREDELRRVGELAAFNQFYGIHLNHLVSLLPESEEDINARQAMRSFVAFLGGDREKIVAKITEQHRGRDEIALIGAVMENLEDLPLLEASCISLARLSADVQASRAAAQAAVAAGRGGQPQGAVPGYLQDSAAPAGAPPRGRGPRQRSNVNFTDGQPASPQAPRLGGSVNDPVTQAIGLLDAATSQTDMDAAVAEALGHDPAIARRRPARAPQIIDDADAPWLQGDDAPQAGGKSAATLPVASPPARTNAPTSDGGEPLFVTPGGSIVAVPAKEPTPVAQKKEPPPAGPAAVKPAAEPTAEANVTDVKTFLSRVVNATVLDEGEDD